MTEILSKDVKAIKFSSIRILTAGGKLRQTTEVPKSESQTQAENEADFDLLAIHIDWYASLYNMNNITKFTKKDITSTFTF
jgi:hypothetical protein